MKLAAALLLALPASSATLRIGVLSLFRPIELTVKPAQGTVARIDAGGQTFYLESWQAAGLRVWKDSVDCFVQRRTVPSEKVRVSARDGGPAEFLLGIPGKIDRRFRGILTVDVEAGVLRAVVEVDRELAVASAVAAESAPGTGIEALKAQAVVARSYYLATRGRHHGYDFCDTTHCQFVREPAGGAALQAATETRGLALMYEGMPVGALFSASCGGRTRTPREIGLQEQVYPFFAVECEPCRRGAKEWISRIDAEEGAMLLDGPPREQVRLEIGRRLGWGTLLSNSYTAERQGDKIVVRGRGSGHGVGLCQFGAAAMARDGADFRVILTHYFPASEVR